MIDEKAETRFQSILSHFADTVNETTRRQIVIGTAALLRRAKEDPEIRRWRLTMWNAAKLDDLAHAVNAQIRGWINYYGRFTRSVMFPLLRRINIYLVRWAQRKYKRLRTSKLRAIRFLASVAKRQPELFAHWKFGVKPDGWTMGAG